MNAKLFLTFILGITLLCFSCRDDDDMGPGEEPGAIFVTVKSFNQLVDNALISTIPETQTIQTGATGTVLINDVPPGIYQVNATHPGIGSGIAPANVASGQIANVIINLVQGVFEAPMISIVSPANQSVFDIGAEVEITANVGDDSDAPQDINLEWSSDIDGLLSTTNANSNGVATLTISTLTEADHVIQVKATDLDGNFSTATLNLSIRPLPNAIVLSPLQAESNGISLNWTVSDEPDFANYKIYRSKGSTNFFQVINVVNDVNDVDYFDNDLQIFSTYYYRIGMVLSNNEESFSNIESVEYSGESIDVGTQIEAMVVDPNRPYIYGLDKVNNSLLFINKEQSVVEKTIFVGSSPTDMDFSQDGDLLFIANFGSTEMAVIDLNTQEIDYTFHVDANAGTWDGNPYRLVVMEGNRVAFTSEDQWNNIKLVNGTTGALLQATGSIYQPDLLKNPSGTVLYVAETGSSGSQLFRYNLQGNQLVEVDASNSGSSTGRTAVISGNGQYIFYQKKKILAANLQSNLGTFLENIYAVDEDGSVAVGEENYYNANNFSIIGSLPVSTRIMAFDTDYETLFLYDTNTSKIIIFAID
ncbi:MAG: hypothetical protein DHS20C18_39100 [Saprospiraceae bacterium]|nr:MAG: hypothetical protein DHS20C18_39100 [Saprospiraceae bacterium]